MLNCVSIRSGKAEEIKDGKAVGLLPCMVVRAYYDKKAIDYSDDKNNVFGLKPIPKTVKTFIANNSMNPDRVIFMYERGELKNTIGR